MKDLLRTCSMVMVAMAILMNSTSAQSTGKVSIGSNPGESAWRSDYKISADDLLGITIYKDPDASGQFRVSTHGFVQHPYLKHIKVAGLTEREVAQRFIAALGDGYFVNPRVTVTVLRYAKIRFVVLGQVNAPETYEVPANRKLSLIEAIGIAKGFTDVANERKVMLTRIVNGKPRSWALNVKDMMNHPERHRPIYIQDGDQITVKESLF